MLQHQMSLPPLRVENSPAQTSDFSKRMNQNSGQSGFDDFTFAASNSNQFYNNNVDDHLIHIGDLDVGNSTWMRMSSENLKQVTNIILYIIIINMISPFIYMF